MKLNKIRRIKEFAKSLSESTARIRASDSSTVQARGPTTLYELHMQLQELTLKGISYQRILLLVWGLLILSVPLDLAIYPFLEIVSAKIQLPPDILFLALLIMGGLSFLLSFHRSILRYGHQLDRGLDLFQRGAGDHPWAILGIFAIFFLFELTVRLESFGIWPVVGIFVAVIVAFPMFAGKWKKQIQELSVEQNRRTRILQGAQRRNFIILMIGIILARGFSLLGALIVAQGYLDFYVFPLVMVASLALLAAAVPAERMFIDKCRRCGRSVPLPLEKHDLCLICTKQRALPKTVGKVSIRRGN